MLWDACHCLCITKLNEKKIGFGCENFALSDTIVQNWTSRPMSQTIWNIGGGPFCQVAKST